MAVLAGDTKNLDKCACMEDGRAVGEVLSRVDTSLSAVDGGLFTLENKSTMRATDRQTDRQTDNRSTNKVKSQILLSFITGEKRCSSPICRGGHKTALSLRERVVAVARQGLTATGEGANRKQEVKKQ